MEVKKAVEKNPCILPPPQTEDKSWMNVRIKTEPCEDVHGVSGVAHACVNTQDPGCKNTGMSDCEEDDLPVSFEQKGSGDSTTQNFRKKDDCEFGKGKVVMIGEDFVVEMDPNYESGDETEIDSEVNVESESGEMEMCVDSSGDMPGAPSKRQGSACLASSGEVAVDGRGRCGSSERSVRSSCGQACVGAAVSAPSTASGSWEASGVESLPGGNVSGPVQRNSSSVRGCGGSEGERCPSCRKEGVPCAVCMGVTGEMVSVEESPEAVQRGRGKKFPCSECGKVFGRRHDVKRHFSAVHRGEKRFSCSECGKAFGESCHLKMHMATVHRREKNFFCEECGKAFGESSHVRMHVAAVHRGEKNFSCPECGKTFCWSSTLKRHMATVHLGEKRFSCSECGKAFGEGSHLKMHMATIHRGEKRFTCPECNNTFVGQSNLNAHMATVHRGEKRFPCPACGKAFGVRSHVKRHMATVHGGEVMLSPSESGRPFPMWGTLRRHFETGDRAENFPFSESA